MQETEIRVKRLPRSWSLEFITMPEALRTETTVLRGHRIEISAPDLPEGARVEVIVVPITIPAPGQRSVLNIIESLRGHRLFKTPEQVRQYLQEERDSWDH